MLILLCNVYVRINIAPIPIFDMFIHYNIKGAYSSNDYSR